MILIGQFDSPFVRRVAISMRLQGVAFEHYPWSVFADAEKIARYNPLMRVPAVVIDGGEVLIESAAILDALEDIAETDTPMMPQDAGDRRKALKVCALATGIADKAVSLVYETAVHNRATPAWVERCLSQIAGALGQLELSRTAHASEWWFGPNIGYADITVACVLRFLGDAHPGMFDLAEGWPLLAAHAARCEAMPVFQEIQQPFYVAKIER
jgi:glutathione S-transferase